MAPGETDLIIYQGATFRRAIRLASNNGVAIDLTGATVRMQIRNPITAETPLVDLTAANGGAVVSDATNGEMTILITDEETAALNWDGRASYDIELEYPDGTVDRILKGKVKLDKEVTR